MDSTAKPITKPIWYACVGGLGLTNEREHVYGHIEATTKRLDYFEVKRFSDGPYTSWSGRDLAEAKRHLLRIVGAETAVELSPEEEIEAIRWGWEYRHPRGR